MTDGYCAVNLTLGIVHWNTVFALRHTLAAVPSEFESLRQIGVASDLIVVDNSSADEARQFLADYELPGFSYRPILNSTNLGLSVARNQIIDGSKASEWVFLLDGDIVLLRSSLSLLVSYLRNHPTVTIAGLFHTTCTSDQESFPREVPQTMRHSALFRPYLIPPCHYGLFRKFLFEHVHFEENGPFGGPGWGSEDKELWHQLRVKNLHSIRAAPILHGHFNRGSSIPLLREQNLPTRWDERRAWVVNKWGYYEPDRRMPFDEIAYKRVSLNGEATLVTSATQRESIADQFEVAIAIVFSEMLPTTIQCLASIAGFTQNYRLYLYDNGSSVEAERYVRRFLESRRIPYIYVKSSVNAGCIPPRNTLFGLAKEPFFVCLDNDVVVSEGWCEKLLEPLREDTRVWQAGAIPVFGVLDSRMVGRKLARAGVEGKADYVEGWCFAVRRKQIMHEFGFLVDNANLDFFWGMDSDLSLRIHQRGGKIVAVPAPVVHLRHRTHPLFDHAPHRRSEDYQERNLEYLVRRWTHGGTVRPSAEVTLDAPQIRTSGRRNHVLVHRGGTAFGDLIMLTAMFRGLREQFPESEIYFLGRKAAQQILGNNPYVDRFLPIPYTRQNILAARRRFSQFYDLHFRRTLNTFEADVVNAYELCCRHVGVTPILYAPVFCPTAGDLSAAYSLLYDLDPALLSEGFILMHVETAPLRTLPDATAVEVASRLARDGHRVVFVGLEADYAKRAEALGGCPTNVHFLQEVGHTYPTRTMFTIPIYARLLIAVDSSFSHAAGALGTPSVLAFGSMDSRLRATHFRNAHVLQKHAACGPCNQNAGECLARPGEVAPCMQAFTADEIVGAACEVLRGNHPAAALTHEDLRRPISIPQQPPLCPSCSACGATGITRIKNHAFYQCGKCRTVFSYQLEQMSEPGPILIGSSLSDEDRMALAEQTACLLRECKGHKRGSTKFLGLYCEGTQPIWRGLPVDIAEVRIPIHAWLEQASLAGAVREALACAGPQPDGIILDDLLNRSAVPRSLLALLRERVAASPIIGRLPVADSYHPRLFRRNCWRHFITPIAGQNRWIPTTEAFRVVMKEAGLECRVFPISTAQEIVFHAGG